MFSAEAMSIVTDSCWDARVNSTAQSSAVLADALLAPDCPSGAGAEPGLEGVLSTLTPRLKDAGITRVAVVTGLDVLGIPVVMVVRPASRSLSVAQGKGPSLLQAKVSGIMEALEHFHAESADVPLRYGSRRELSTADKAVVDPHRLPRTSAALTDQTPLLWARAESMLGACEGWVPFELVHLDYRYPLPAGSGFFLGSSTGLGCGLTRGDAERSALLEVVERHQIAMFQRHGASAASLVDLTQVHDPTCRWLLDRCAQAGVAVSLWDSSAPELGVSCFQCELVDERRDPLRALGCARGYGCHFDASVAFERALCEAAQSRLTAIAGTRDDVYEHDVSLVRSPAAHAAAQIRRSGARTEPWPGVAGRALVDAERAQAELCERLVRQGFGPPLVVDLSKPDWPVHVVRVLVPGLLNTEPHPSPEDGRA